jgi:hypothetical protein
LATRERLQESNHFSSVVGRCEPAIRLHAVAGHHLIGVRGGAAVEPSLKEVSKREAEYYLAEAEFCAELAESMKRPDYKDRWLKIAQEWRDLAKQAGRGGEATQHRIWRVAQDHRCSAHETSSRMPWSGILFSPSALGLFLVLQFLR